jgi:hypothetical protein
MSQHPNILCIIAEDICPDLGCYGDKDAITPNINSLAAKGMHYNHVSSVGPICAPARTTLALGMYPPTLGAQHMRSNVTKPTNSSIISEYLQDAGYFCAIIQGIQCSMVDASGMDISIESALEQALYDVNPIVRMAAAEALIHLEAGPNAVSRAESILAEMLAVRDDVLLIMAAVDTMDRLGEKVSKLLYLVNDLRENVYIGKSAELERYTQTISPSVMKLFRQ